MATLIFQAKQNRRPFRRDNGEIDTLSEQQRSQLDDVVSVYPDGTKSFGSRVRKSEWLAAGRAEADWPGSFLIVHVPDLPYAKALRLTERLTFLGHPWKVLLSNIPTAVRQKLKQDGEITISLAAVKDHIVHKLDARTLDQV